MRSSGRTFRSLLYALKIVSEGVNVIYITTTPGAKEDAHKRAIDMCSGLRLVEVKKDMVIINDVRLIFMTKRQMSTDPTRHLRGIVGTVVIDHETHARGIDYFISMTEGP